MSKVRINDLAKELEVKSRAILDVLPGIGVPPGKTHSSSLELDEAEKVRAHFAREAKRSTHAGAASGRHGAEPVVPKIDLSNISKPGDVMKALLAKKKEEEEDSRKPRVPVKASVAGAGQGCCSRCAGRYNSRCRNTCCCSARPAGTTQDCSAATLSGSDRGSSTGPTSHRFASSRRSCCCQSSCRGCGRAPDYCCGAASGWGGRKAAGSSGCAR